MGRQGAGVGKVAVLGAASGAGPITRTSGIGAGRAAAEAVAGGMEAGVDTGEAAVVAEAEVAMPLGTGSGVSEAAAVVWLLSVC